ncbi:SprT-like domain-containing protein [Alkalimarinus alittae]|uniref:SprT-like domain-containing protein n=1 Tax=Alkalimarinus alittae TaxID=2961619 RepID=A0ABY6MXM0_9ALTE|nr:SprT-like domain-containing protein [Alkalimarinus alittae]UZE94534.1 SprT-like domain-containing protein [Alkalimarinus alittae]
MNPTSELYKSLLLAYDHFNEALFENSLPQVIFTMQRKKGVMGYFAAERWGNLDGDKCNEIAINPSYFANSRLIEVMQTLVHEMVHCWQHCFGTPGRDYYHNREWAEKMMQVGLMPSSTGEVGGQITGQVMGDYIIEGGKFIVSCKILQSDQSFQLNWIDRMSLPRLFDPVIGSSALVIGEQSTKEESSVVKGFSLPNTSTSTDSNVQTVKSISPETPYLNQLPNDFLIHEAAKRQTRFRFICSGCGTKVYGKEKLNISCNDCDLKFHRD